jgi:tyrosyl-tRNA synthetase
MTDEMKFANELWAINRSWNDWIEMFGRKKCVEAEGSISLADALVESGLCESKSDARRTIEGNGASIWFKKETDPKFIIHKSAQEAHDICLIQKGKHGNHMTSNTAIIYWKPDL